MSDGSVGGGAGCLRIKGPSQFGFPAQTSQAVHPSGIDGYHSCRELQNTDLFIDCHQNPLPTPNTNLNSNSNRLRKVVKRCETVKVECLTHPKKRLASFLIGPLPLFRTYEVRLKLMQILWLQTSTSKYGKNWKQMKLKSGRVLQSVKLRITALTLILFNDSHKKYTVKCNITKMENLYKQEQPCRMGCEIEQRQPVFNGTFTFIFILLLLYFVTTLLLLQLFFYILRYG